MAKTLEQMDLNELKSLAYDKIAYVETLNVEVNKTRQEIQIISARIKNLKEPATEQYKKVETDIEKDEKEKTE